MFGKLIMIIAELCTRIILFVCLEGLLFLFLRQDLSSGCPETHCVDLELTV